MTFNSYSRENTTCQDYLYQGKEIQNELNLGTYDFGARNYDPAICKWLSVDPLAEKYPGMSPYSPFANNPILFVDPNGEEIWIYYKDDEGNEQKMQYTAGMKYTGKNEFVAASVKGLNQMNKTKNGGAVLGDLIKSENSFNVINSYVKDKNGDDISGVFSFVGNENGGGEIKAAALLDKELGDLTKLESVSHELFHGYQHEKGQGGASIMNEVEAGMFGYSVALEYALSNGQNFASGTSVGGNNQAGAAYEKAFSSLLGVFQRRLLKTRLPILKLVP